jgi:hypothetical protein
MKTWQAVLVGLSVAIAAIAGLEAPLRVRRLDLEAKLKAQEVEVGRLTVIKVQIDGYQKRRDRLNSRIERIERLRDETVCGWPLPGLDLSRQDAARIDGVVVEGGTLTILGTAADQAAVERLATGIRGAPWAREVKAGRSSRGTFGLFARLDAPKCHLQEKPDSGAETQP